MRSSQTSWTTLRDHNSEVSLVRNRKGACTRHRFGHHYIVFARPDDRPVDRAGRQRRQGLPAHGKRPSVHGIWHELGLHPDRRRTINLRASGSSRTTVIIEAALEREMPLLKSDGCQRDPAVRRHSTARWVQYIYEQLRDPHGAQPSSAHAMGSPSTVSGSPRSTTPTRALRAAVTADVIAQSSGRMFRRNVPGLLHVVARQREQLRPVLELVRDRGAPPKASATCRPQGVRYLYSLFGEIIRGHQGSSDPDRPVAMANGDLQYIDIIAEECHGTRRVRLERLSRNFSPGPLPGGRKTSSASRSCTPSSAPTPSTPSAHAGGSG